jgi:hypothetical protein
MKPRQSQIPLPNPNPSIMFLTLRLGSLFLSSPTRFVLVRAKNLFASTSIQLHTMVLTGLKRISLLLPVLSPSLATLMLPVDEFLELMTWNSGLVRCTKAHKIGENQARVLQGFCKIKGVVGVSRQRLLRRSS